MGYDSARRGQRPAAPTRRAAPPPADEGQGDDAADGVEDQGPGDAAQDDAPPPAPRRGSYGGGAGGGRGQGGGGGEAPRSQMTGRAFNLCYLPPGGEDTLFCGKAWEKQGTKGIFFSLQVDCEQLNQIPVERDSEGNDVFNLKLFLRKAPPAGSGGGRGDGGGQSARPPARGAGRRVSRDGVPF